jgi:hypothetical protein
MFIQTPEKYCLNRLAGPEQWRSPAEKTGRRCYMMELSHLRTVDVIVARYWEQATGKKAVLSAG